MTYAEARQIMRRLYDERVAAQKLHEVLEKAAEAESSLGPLNTALAAGEAKLRELMTQFQADKVKYNASLAILKTDLSNQQEDAKTAILATQDSVEKARNTNQVEIDSLAQTLQQARQAHMAAIATLEAETKRAKEQRDKVLAELDNLKKSAKARFSTLFD